MNIYTRLAGEVIQELGGYRLDVERAMAEGCQIDTWLFLRAGSDRYTELTRWGLDEEQRCQLDAAIKTELRRAQILGWR